MDASRVIVLLMMGVWVAGCEEPGPIGAPMPVARPARVLIERMVLEPDEVLHRRAEGIAGRARLGAELRRRARRPWRRRVRGGIKYADLLQRVYAKRDGVKLLTTPGGLTPRGRAVLAVLKKARRHGLSPSTYHIKRIEQLDAKLSKQKEPPWSKVTLRPAEVEALVLWLRSRGLDPEAPDTRRAVYDAILGLERAPGTSGAAAKAKAKVKAKARAQRVKPDGEDGKRGDAASEDDGPAALPPAPKPMKLPPVPRVAKQSRAFERALRDQIRAQTELELRVVDGALRLARDLRLFNVRRLDWKALKAAGGSKNIIYDRLERFLEGVEAVKPAQVEARYRALWPAHPQYVALVTERARYSKIVLAGGWREVKPFRVKRGARSAAIRALRARLTVEGYLDEASSAKAKDLADGALFLAIKRFRVAHQLRADARTTPAFWRALNTTAQARLDQIDLALERWRESWLEQERRYIHVNLPGFTAALWDGGKRVHHFKVVIGKANRECDPEKQRWVYPNATPELMSELEYFILNPSWYVPSRIIEQEIKPKLEDDPEWLKKNHYELVRKRGARMVIRQKPGDHNALGRVKFIFPNKHNTYMHDTPRKKYFTYTRRAYSHGCMRVHEPLKFAEALAGVDAQKDVVVRDVVKSGATRMVKLKARIPVFVEYYTVWVDDAGRVQFLDDVYLRDARRLSDDPRAFDRCEVKLPEGSGDDEVPPDTSADLGP